MDPLPAPSELAPAAPAPERPPLSLAARIGGILGLAAATVGGLVLGLGASLPPVAGVAATFLGTLGAARLLAGGEERFRNRALRWLARRTRDTWVNWGTGVYGLGALTRFIYLESRWLFALGQDPRDLLDRSLGEWIAWSIREGLEALAHAIQSLFWPIDLYQALGLPLTAAVIASGWLTWKLAWQGTEDPLLDGPPSGAPAPEDDAIGPAGVGDSG